MNVKPAKKLTAADQSARFVEAAKKAEVDESGRKFDDAFKRVAKQKRIKSPSRP